MVNIKKFLFFLTLICLFQCGQKSQHSNEGNISIDVSITGLNQGKIVIEQLKIRDRIPLDTFDIQVNGTAKLKINSKDFDVFLIKVLDQQGEIIFIANQGDHIKITADSKNISRTFRISGSQELEKLDEFILKDRVFGNYRDSLNRIYLALKERNNHYTVEDEFNALYERKAIQHERYVMQYLDKNLNLFGNILTVRSLDLKRFPQYYQKVLKSLKSNYPNSEHVIAFDKELQKVFATEVGGQAAEFSLPSIDGKTVNLSSFKGKYVLLDFWATWCKPCIAEIPNLKNIQQTFKREKFEIISVCIDRTEFKPIWQKIIKEHEATWVQLFDAGGQTAESYSIEYFPTIILLDPEGNIVAKNLRGEEISLKLKEIFKK